MLWVQRENMGLGTQLPSVELSERGIPSESELFKITHCPLFLPPLSPFPFSAGVT